MDQQSDRLTWEEAQGLVQMHRRKAGFEESVSLSAVARSLNVSNDEARLMLTEYRKDHSGPRKSAFIDRSGVLSAVLAAAAVLFFVLWAYGARRPSTALAMTSTQPVATVKKTLAKVSNSVCLLGNKKPETTTL